jgi:hypothetical protein
MITFLFICLNGTSTFAVDSTPTGSLSTHEEALSQKCNREARNALINGDIELVETVCTQAMEEIDKSHENKEYLINPMLNLAFSYTLAGQFDKATPLYNKARDIRKELYGPDSQKVKEIDRLIEEQEKIKRHNSSQ